jgi:hypothetical protein
MREHGGNFEHLLQGNKNKDIINSPIFLLFSYTQPIIFMKYLRRGHGS